MASSRNFTLFFRVSLFRCFDHFIGVFDGVGRSMLSCYHGVHGERHGRAFSDTKLFFARSMGT